MRAVLAPGVCVATVLAAQVAWSAADATLAEVRVERGAPVVVIGGEPQPPIIYRENLPWAHLDEGVAHYASMAGAGVRVFVVGSGLALTHSPEQRDQSRAQYLVPAIEKVLDAAGPEGRIILLLTTTLQRSSAPQWAEANPDEMMVWPPEMQPGDRASVSSLAWRELACEGLRDIVRWVDQSPYADRIVGWFLCGAAGEWLDYWDYSPAAVASFRRWLTRRYGTDAALQGAWHQPDTTLQSAQLPEWERLFEADTGLFHDAARSRQVIDFMQWYHEELAEAAAQLAATLKQADPRRLVGLWNGYYFFSGWSSPENGVFRRRQGAFNLLLDDPNIDFFVAPYGYGERFPGGVFVPQFLNDSMALHGKLAIVEEDSRTALAAQVEAAYDPDRSDRAYVTIGDSFGRSYDIDESVAVMMRNFAGCFTKPGTGLWWYCLGNVGGWYDHPRLLDTVTRLRAVAERNCFGDRRAAQIAVIVSNESLWYQRFNTLQQDLIARQTITGLARIGAPYDVYLDTDLEHPDFPFDRYRLFILLNTFHLSEQQRRIISGRVQRDDRTVLSIYATGFASDDGLSVEGIREVTGMEIASAQVTLRKGAEVVVTDYSHPMTASLAPCVRFGTRSEIGPIMWCADPGATVLGDLVATDDSGGVFTLARRGGIAVRDLGDWRSVWVAVPGLPPALLRGIAEAAGVHIYDAQDDVVFASERLLAVHTLYAGTRTIRLPRERRVLDALSGETVAAGAREFTVYLPARRTGLWELR
ncbi:MAG: beta-galactosidase [Armatimonadota bacterium]